ncbi:MAG: bifunctional DNA-formamidopyrimidine glycosylase/DNA-(apurinic or apyrimidinic site) lyase [Candidatus Levyibacteriota bacterium]
MPELPEVETIRLGLQKYLVGHKILDVEVKVPKIFQGNRKNVIGAKVIGVKRIGKGLIIELDNDYALAIHLKLTGQIIYSGKETSSIHFSVKTGGSLPSKYTHVIFKLDKDAFLYYNDLRKFGWIRVIKKDELNDLPFFKEMGPEPLKDLTFSKFIKIIQISNSPIKIILMDQKKIGGIGNIYANEALFLSGINPRRSAKNLSNKEIQKLYGAIVEALKRGLKYGGSSDVNFVNAFGQDGNYQNHFLVYSRKGQKCQRCKGIIQKIQLGGRGTYFCLNCQK